MSPGLLAARKHCEWLMAALTAPILLVQGDDTMQLLVALASAAIPAQTVAPMSMILLQHIMEKISMGGSGERRWRVVLQAGQRGPHRWREPVHNAKSTSAVSTCLVHSAGLAVQGHQLARKPQAALHYPLDGLPFRLAVV